MDIHVSLRVVRGPDWKWGDQDGGEGCVGTVVVVCDSEEDHGRTTGRAAVVQWDAGNRCNYRCGIEGKYDLRVYDSAQKGIVHANVICDSCREAGICGIRWKCVSCYDYDLCTICYNAGKHNLDHEFFRMDKPDGARISIQPRLRARKLAAKGLFPNAEVIRGHDWIWGEQDGGLGRSGKVVSIKNQEKTKRCVVEVVWRESGKKNQYRAGLKGMMDVKCKELGSGGYFYPDHLEVLGAPSKDTTPTKVPKFAAGEHIRVQLEEDLFKAMQKDHGGWNDQLATIIGELGTIQSVMDNGDLRIRYPNNRVWTLNPDVVTKVVTTSPPPTSKVKVYKERDVVRIINDIAEVHTLQENHGGWVDDMALSLGQVGRVVRVFPSGDLRISVNGNTWTFNPLCVVPAPGENPPEIPDDSELMGLGGEDGDIGMHLKLLSIMENPAVIVAAAAAGDADTLKSFLIKHPKEVNAKAVGKAAIHCAAVAGHMNVLKAILEFNPDLEIQDEDGDRALHLCAYSDEDEATKLLMDAGANVNSKNNKEATPMIIAAVKGHTSVLRLLANHPKIKLAEQDADGDTALHCAVLAQKNESVSILLDAGANPILVNFRFFTPVHEAAKIGFLPAMEQFIRKFPEHINIKKDDGYTPLHLAALNDHLDVLTALVDDERCSINERTAERQTALHVAVHQGHSRIVERLVGFGSDLSLQDNDGDTPLHIALLKESADPLSAETPQLKKVRESLNIPEDSPSQASATVACFLVREGANIYVQNNKGHTPLQLCAPDIAALITSFIGTTGIQKFHNSLRTPPPVSETLIRHTTIHMDGGMESGKGLSVGRQPNFTAPVTALKKEEQASPSATKEVPSVDPEEACFMCEAKIDVKFIPCEHAVMCSTCAQRAKRCPTCRAPVKSILKLPIKCSMCSIEEASVTLKPCEHQFCPECARRMKVCFDCKIEIILKEGLPPEKLSKKTPSGPTPSANCPICLTEPKNTAFLCGHQLCWDCAQKVDHCPVCRKFVTHRIQLFQ